MSEEEDDEYYYSEDQHEVEEEEEEEGVVMKTPVVQTPKVSNNNSNHKLVGTPGEDGEYLVLSPEDLHVLQSRVIHNVADILGIPKDRANVLLLHFKWNQDALIESYIANPSGTCHKAGAEQGQDLNEDSGSGTTNGVVVAAKQVFCQIFCDYIPYEETFSMGCTTIAHPEDHRFSFLAWRSYLQVKVEEGPSCLLGRCPMEGCNCVVSPSVWRMIFKCNSMLDLKNFVVLEKLADEGKLISSTKYKTVSSSSSSNSSSSKKTMMELDVNSLPKLPEMDPLCQATLEKYERHLSNSFVEMNKRMKWCPSAGCSQAIMATGSVTEVKCNLCKYQFCFRCDHEAHAPAKCKTLSLWLEKCTNESETANWMIANTKTCPQCNTRIEKNQGCNHMVCSRCRHEFCWICMGAWTTHGTESGGYYNCNKFQQGTKPENEDTAQKAKRELDRYLFYYKRFHEHEVSLKFAHKQRADALRKMEEIQQKDKTGGWADVEYLEQAVDQLIECRRVLKYTYVYSFYLEDGPAKTLFEHNQTMLESNTEKLSELTEKSIDKIDRAEIVNFTRVTGRFVKSLLEQISD